MDKIIISDLEVYAYHGVNQEENVLGQRFLISIEAELNLQGAGLSDDLEQTVNYAKLCHEIEGEFRKINYHLIEKAAEELCFFILQQYSAIQKVRIKVKKPWAPIGKPLDYAAVELQRKWHVVYVGLGSNLGDKERYLQTAIEMMENHPRIKGISQSKFYTTKPVGYLEQDDFLNAVVCIHTMLSPKHLIRFLQGIEEELKRVRTIPNGPRTIDLDVLLYDDFITVDSEIILPHPRMHERKFVLEPLCEIAPYAMHPLLNKRMVNLLQQLEI